MPWVKRFYLFHILISLSGGSNSSNSPRMPLSFFWSFLRYFPNFFPTSVYSLLPGGFPWLALLPGMTSLSPVPTSSHATNFFPLLNSTYSIDSVSWLAGRRESTSSIDWDLTTSGGSDPLLLRVDPFLLIAAREQTTYLYYHSNLSLLNRCNIPYYPSSQLILLWYIGFIGFEVRFDWASCLFTWASKKAY